MTEEKETTEECQATNLLQEGRRHFICREFAQSVEKLSEACELMVEKYGEGNVMLADAFYSYGEALLEMARMETPVLGNALKDVPDVIAEGDDKENTEEPDESLNDEMKEEIADKVIEALCEAPIVENSDKSADKDSDNKQTEGEATENKGEGSEGKKDEVKKPEETAEAPATDDKNEAEGETGDKDEETADGDSPMEEGENAEADDGEEGAEDADGDEEDGEETTEADEAAAGNDEENEVGNLQLAWEIIEVARTLYEKKATAESEACVKSKLRIADCHRKLGEVMLERDEWIPAAEELQKCLEIERKTVELPNRRVAETYFEIGVAFDNAEKLQESADAFEKSAECLQEFQKKLKDKTEKSSDDEAEIKELDLVLEEIKTRITEVKQKKVNQPEPLGDGGASSSSGVTTNGFGSGSTDLNGATTVNGFGHSSENGNSTKETQDISHLIRKRPKDSDSAESPVKKVRVDPAGDVPEAVSATSD